MLDPVTLAVSAAVAYGGNALKEHIEGFCKDQAFSWLHRKFEARPQDLFFREAVVKQAGQKTIAAFPEFKDEQFFLILQQWCNSGKFARLYTHFQEDTTADISQIAIAGFVDVARGFERSGIVSPRAGEILLCFFQSLKEAVLASDEGLVFKNQLDEKRFDHLDQLQENNHDLTRTVSELVQSHIELTRRLLSVEIASATVAKNVVEQELKRSIETALKWSENGSFDAGQSLVAEIRSHHDFGSLSPAFQARIATIAAKCAEGLGQQKTAVEEIELALKLTPDELRAISNGAGAALLQGHWERAITLAKRAIELDAKDENASLVLVQVWTEQGDFDAIEEFLIGDPHFLDLPHGLAILASTRLAQGHTEEAVELARRGVRLDGKCISALEELYDSCFRPIRDKMMREGWLRRSHSTNRHLQSAQAAIGRAARLVEDSLNRALWRRLAINQSAVASVRGRFAEALALSERILNDRPAHKEREFALSTQGFSLLRLGRYQEAIAPLREIQFSDRHPEAAFGLAHCLNSIGEIEEAATLFESIWKPEDKIDAEELNNLLIAEELIDIYRSQDKPNEAQKVLTRLEGAYDQNPEVRAIVADMKRAEGYKDEAVALLIQIIEQSRDEDENVVGSLWIRLADWHYKDSHFKEAAAAFAQVPLECLVPPFARAFLHALYASEQLKRALEVAQLIRRREGFDPRAAEIEAAILSYQGERDEARAIYRELARREPRERYHVVNEAHVAVQSGDDEGAKTLLQTITVSDFAMNAHELRRIAALKSHLKMDDALEFAFRARQIDYGNPESHRLYVSIFLKLTQFHSVDENGVKDNSRAARVLGLNGPTWGAVPCTIRMAPIHKEGDTAPQLVAFSDEEPGTDQSAWRAFTILERGPFDHAHGFYAPQDELAQRLLAMKADDTIRLYCAQTQSERLFRVGAVLHPYVHAFQESNTEAQKLFPDGSSSLRTIDVRNGFDEFWAFMEKQLEGDEYFFDGYKTWKTPLSCLAHWRGRSYADSWEWVCSAPSFGLHAQRGSFEDWEQSVEAVRQSLLSPTPTLVLDWGGLLALKRWNLHDSVGPHFRYLAPESLHRRLKAEVEETRVSDGAFVVPTSTGWRAIEQKPEERQSRIRQIEELLNFFEEHVQVVPPREVINFPKTQLDEWSDILGECTLDSILVALEYKFPLFADDAVLRRLLPFCPGLETVCSTSSQAILRALHQKDKLTQDVYFEAMRQLLSNNYKFLFADSSFYDWLIQREDYKLTPEVRRLFALLEGPNFDSETAIHISAQVVVALIHSEETKDKIGRFWNIFDWVLLVLATGRPAHYTLLEFRRVLAHPSFKLSPKFNLCVAFHLDRWLGDVGF